VDSFGEDIIFYIPPTQTVGERSLFGVLKTSRKPKRFGHGYEEIVEYRPLINLVISKSNLARLSRFGEENRPR
jgi:hypothetical protein